MQQGRLLTLNESTAPSMDITKYCFKVGREQTNDLTISNNMVSPTHFEIKLLFFTFQITDYSENGTYLSKSRIGKFNTVTLKDGDIIHVCNSDDEVIGFEFKCGSCLYDSKKNDIFKFYHEEEVPIRKKVNIQQDNQKEEHPLLQFAFQRFESHSEEDDSLNDSDSQSLAFEQHEFLGANMSKFENIQSQCKSCAGKEWKDYQCEETQIHVLCAQCQRFIPKRILTEEENDQLKMHCFICRAYHCQYYYGDCTRLQQDKFLLVKELEKFMVIPQNYINPTEYNRLKIYLNGQPEKTIFNYMAENYINKGDFVYQENKRTSGNPIQEINYKISPETPVCGNCINKLINYIIFKYAQCQNEPLFKDCQYGINCKDLDLNHAKQYNHFCEQTKFD